MADEKTYKALVWKSLGIPWDSLVNRKFYEKADEYHISDQLMHAIDTAIESLADNQRTTIKYRWGLVDGIARTQEETGRYVYNGSTGRYGVTKQQVSQLERKGLSKIRGLIIEAAMRDEGDAALVQYINELRNEALRLPPGK